MPTSKPKASGGENEQKAVIVSHPKFMIMRIGIMNAPNSPLVQNAFSFKARKKMEERQREGAKAAKKKTTDPRDFEQNYRDAMHISTEGWSGVPAPAFRNAMISACRMVGFKMTHAKLSVFVDADGTDASDGGPLVRIYGEPEVHEGTVRNQSGVTDLRWRPMWREWKAVLNIRYDSDQFSPEDLLNLLTRAGIQVGIQEGRPDSRSSNGLGWGQFIFDPDVEIQIMEDVRETAEDMLKRALSKMDKKAELVA